VEEDFRLHRVQYCNKRTADKDMQRLTHNSVFVRVYVRAKMWLRGFRFNYIYQGTRETRKADTIICEMSSTNFMRKSEVDKH